MEEIDRLKHDDGYTDEQIKKTGLYKTLQQQERELAAADPDRFAREVKEAKKKDIEKRSSGAVLTSELKPSAQPESIQTSAMDVSEKESEQLLIVSQQIDLLKQIEENTRSLKGLDAVLKSAMDKIGTAGGSDSGGGGGGIDLGGLGDLGNGPARRRDSRGRGIGSKLKRLGRGAIELGAKGARAALPYALPAAIAYGAARTLDYGASALGVGDVEIDETEDEANWQKMSAGQKIGSGIARGIESVGSFLGLESFAKEAEASRIEKETKMLQGQTQSSGASEQTIETNIKFQKEIEAVGAGSVTQTKIQTDDGIEVMPAIVNDKQVGTIGDEGLIAKLQQEDTLRKAQAKAGVMLSVQSIEPIQDMGGRVYQESDQLRSIEKTVIQQSAPNIINAPTTNVNQTTNNVTRPPARNTDSTYREYSKSRFSW
jgi:hypothetical protein